VDSQISIAGAPPPACLSWVSLPQACATPCAIFAHHLECHCHVCSASGAPLLVACLLSIRGATACCVFAQHLASCCCRLALIRLSWEATYPIILIMALHTHVGFLIWVLSMHLSWLCSMNIYTCPCIRLELQTANSVCVSACFRCSWRALCMGESGASSRGRSGSW